MDLANGIRRRASSAVILTAVVVAIALAAATVTISIAGPRVHVRWRSDLSPADRLAREQRYDLRNASPHTGAPTTWAYNLGNRTRTNVGALVADPAVEDTANIDRVGLTVPPRQVRLGFRPLPFPFSTTEQFRDPWQLFQVQSLWLWVAGGVSLWAAQALSGRRRRNVMIGILTLTGAAAWTFPISPALVTMGDATQSVLRRDYFEGYAGVDRVRFEAHLTAAVLGQLDAAFGRTQESPVLAQTGLMRAAAAAFVLCAIAVGFLERWSSAVVRYLGLTLFAPAALMYFGWREFGYLSLNLAVFPLILRGLRDDNWYLETGSLLAGIGAALHGFGLISICGLCLAGLIAPARTSRVGRALRIGIWGTAGYTVWLPLYIIVMKLPIVTGHLYAIPWRPWFAPTEFADRVNPALFSAAGLRDLAMTAWVAGAPLVGLAASLWKRYPHVTSTALVYSLPSVLFTLLVWPTQGLHEEIDLVFALFPALYALAWTCSLDPGRTRAAAVLLASGHLAFWRIALDESFAALWAAGP